MCHYFTTISQGKWRHYNVHCTYTLYNDSQVIQVFEDSCGSEWLGQIDNSSGDGAYSPSVWLVTPLISKLQHSVLGRVLKCAGQVLGQGQWWNPDKNQEKRRSTRATRYRLGGRGEGEVESFRTGHALCTC